MDNKSNDSGNGNIQNALKTPEKIITSCHGFLLLHKENLKKIFDNYAKDDHPVAFVAVIGPSKSGKSFMTNLIIQYEANDFGNGEEGWLERLMKEGEFFEGFRFGSVASSEKLFESSKFSSGIYLWPTPFLMTKPNEEKVCIWVLHYRIPDISSKTNAEDADWIEDILGLTCSRILEIMTGNQELRVARARRLFSFHGHPLTSPANVCDSVVILNSAESNKNSSKVLTEVDAKKWLLDLPESSGIHDSVLDEFKYLKLIRMQKISKPLHDVEGRFIQDTIKPLIKTLRLTMDTFLMDDEIIPKKIQGKAVRVTNVVEFLDDCVNCVNQVSSRIAEAMDKIPWAKETVTKQQCRIETMTASQNGDKAKNAEKPFKQLEIENPVVSPGIPEKHETPSLNELLVFKVENSGAIISAALLDFEKALQLALPLHRPSQFHDESMISTISQKERRKLLVLFMDKISDLSGDKISELIKELDAGIQKILSEYKTKNGEHRKKSAQLVEQVVDFLSTEFESCINSHLKLDPQMELETLKSLLALEKQEVMNNFSSYWKPGSAEFHRQYQIKLEKRLNDFIQCSEEKQMSFLEGPAERERKLFEEAKLNLLEKCIQFENDMATGNFYFKTDVSRDLFLKKVEKARTLLNKSDLALEEIQKKIDVLVKASSKYYKSK